MKRMMFLFVLALCMAGCTAQTRIERVQMPVPAAESIAAEDATTEGEEVHSDAQSISSPTKTIRETVELGEEDTEPEPVSCPVCGGEMVTQQKIRSTPKPARRSGWAACTPSRSEASSAMTAVKIAVRSRADTSFSSAMRGASPATICGKGLAI